MDSRDCVSVVEKALIDHGRPRNKAFALFSRKDVIAVLPVAFRAFPWSIKAVEKA
jgi:hypothetical protein